MPICMETKNLTYPLFALNYLLRQTTAGAEPGLDRTELDDELNWCHSVGRTMLVIFGPEKAFGIFSDRVASSRICSIYVI
jgi:hypothetical protein